MEILQKKSYLRRMNTESKGNEVPSLSFNNKSRRNNKKAYMTNGMEEVPDVQVAETLFEQPSQSVLVQPMMHRFISFLLLQSFVFVLNSFLSTQFYTAIPHPFSLLAAQFLLSYTLNNTYICCTKATSSKDRSSRAEENRIQLRINLNNFDTFNLLS